MPINRILGALGALRRTATARGEAGAARRSAAAALLIRLASAAVAYLAQVVLARLMGQHEYGVFAYTWVWFMIIAAVASLGLADVSLRLIPEMRLRNENDHLRGFILFGPAVAVASSIAVAVAIIAALQFGPALVAAAYVLPMMVMVLAVPIVCAQSFLEGLGRSYGWVTAALLPTYVLRHGFLLVMMVGAVAIGFAADAVTAFFCLIAAVFLSLLVQSWTILGRLRHVLELGPRAYRGREWLGASFPFAILYGCSYLFSFADVMVLSFFVDPAEIAIYFAATRIIQVVNLIPFAATVGTAHLFAEANARSATEEMQALSNQVGLMTFVVAVACALAIAVGGHWLLSMFGSSYETGYACLVILAIGITVRVAAGPAEDILNMSGNGALSASTYAVVVVISIALNVALIMPFGIEGAAVATSLALAGRAIWLARSARTRVGVTTFVWASFRRPSGKVPAPQPAE